ncbi:MAG: hypothetical protein WC947_04635 [Elusimicrobiota bacterium]
MESNEIINDKPERLKNIISVLLPAFLLLFFCFYFFIPMQPVKYFFIKYFDWLLVSLFLVVFLVIVNLDSASLFNKLPKGLNNYFNEIGIKPVKIWWPKYYSSLLGMPPYMQGRYKDHKLVYEIIYNGPTRPYIRKIIFFHKESLNLGLLFRYNTSFSFLRELDDWGNFFEKKFELKLSERNVNCRAVDVKNAEGLLNEYNTIKTIECLVDITKNLADSSLIFNDRYIKVSFTGKKPGKEFFDAVHNLSTLLENSKSGITETKIRIIGKSAVYLVFLTVFSTFILWRMIITIMRE